MGLARIVEKLFGPASPLTAQIVGSRNSVSLVIDRQWLVGLAASVPAAQRLLNASTLTGGDGDWGGPDFATTDAGEVKRDLIDIVQRIPRPERLRSV